MGYFFETVGDDKMAEKHYNKAIFLGKGQATFHDNYAVYLCSRGKYKEADKEFMIATKDYNYAKTAQIYENAGLCALQATDLTKAENYFKIAVRYDPAQVTSMLELSELSLKRGEIGQAQHFLDKLRQRIDPTPRILWLSIQVARKNNDNDAIASNALLLKNLFANSPEYKLYLQSQEGGV
jgi:type IV pilus assembly protein PilF